MADLYTYKDIRQSDAWFCFWESLGWQRVVFDTNLSIRYSKTIFGASIFIERSSDISDEMLKKIEKFAHSIRAVSLQVRPGILQKSDCLEKNNYIIIKDPVGVTKTGIINLSAPIVQMHKKLSYRVRHLIKRSLNTTKIQIKNDYNASEIDEFYDIYSKNGRDKKFHVHSNKAFHSFMESFRNLAYLCIVRDFDNNYLGGCVFACEGKTAWYLFSAMNTLGREFYVGYGILWSGINFLKDKGFEFLDLEGVYDERFPKTYKTHTGYSSFKEQFHPEIIYYPKQRVKYFSKFYQIISFD